MYSFHFRTTNSLKESLDKRNVDATMRRARDTKLARLAEGTDQDLLAGRFASAFRDGGIKNDQTSTTRDSKRSVATALSVADAEEVKECEQLKEFLDTDLKTYFASSADSNLFIKTLCSDGIVTLRN